MAALEVDLEIDQGSDWAMKWPVTDGGAAVDLTAGWSLRGHVRKRLADTETLYEWDSSDGTAVLEADGFTLLVANTVSSGWTWKSAVYDVELVQPGGAVTRVLQGKVTVDPEVTR